MCGILGIASAYTNGFSTKEAGTFFDMLYFDALRGMDSTGVFGVDKHGNVNCHKEASQAGVFLQHDKMKDFRSKLVSSGMFAVGHNRAATRGAVTDKNAHPFWVDDKIVLVQNGTYKGSHKHHKDTEVDTEAIAHVLSDEPDIEKALKSVNAAYALVWFNTETKKLHLIRNDERPLWVGKYKGGTLAWCSEPGFMYMAGARNGLEFETKPEELEPFTLATLSIEGNTWKREDKVLDAKYSFRYDYTQGANEPWPYQGPTNYRHNYRNDVNGDAEQIDSLLSEILLKKVEDTHIPFKQINEIKDKVSSWQVTDTKRCYPVEVIDYEPANNHPQCTSWHVWGTFCADYDVFDPRVVAHWFVKGVDEAGILEYTTNEFYMAEMASCRSHTVNSTHGVVTCFMHNIVQLETQDANVQ